MSHKKPRNFFQYGAFLAALFVGFAVSAYAEERAEDKATNAQPQASQPQQQAAPAQPSGTEPVDDDDGTALA